MERNLKFPVIIKLQVGRAGTESQDNLVTFDRLVVLCHFGTARVSEIAFI